MELIDFSYIIIVVILVWQVYEFFYPTKPKPNAQPEVYQRLEEIKRQRRERNAKGEFNDKDLTKYDGISNPEYYVGIKGTVFDVSSSKDFIRGGEYEMLAGQECSVNFAKMVVDPQYFFKYGKIELTEEEEQQLDAVYQTFEANYKIVGQLQSMKKYN